MTMSPSLSAADANVLRSIQVLYPSRYYSNYSAAHDGSCGKTGINRKRFSTLLLEYGEREVYDWAVVASSSRNSSSTNKGETAVSKVRSSSTGTISGASIGNGNNSSRSYLTTGHSNGTVRKRKKKRGVGVSSQNSAAALAAAEGTNDMKCIQGRLYLCTKSIVFEPNDFTRGVIRFPFDKMTSTPALSASPTSVQMQKQQLYQQQHQYQQQQLHHTPETTSISFTTTKYIVMKKNNIITPYTIIDESHSGTRANNNDVNRSNCYNNYKSSSNNKIHTTTFSFTFLFSKPFHFLHMYDTLVQHYHHQHQQQQREQNHQNISLLNINLVQKFNTHNFIHLSEIPKTDSLSSYILSPLSSQPGCTMITQERFYFQPMHGIVIQSSSSSALNRVTSSNDGTFDNNINTNNSTSSMNHNQTPNNHHNHDNANNTRVFSWKLTSIVATARRYHGLKDHALELFFNNNDYEHDHHDNGDYDDVLLGNNENDNTYNISGTTSSTSNSSSGCQSTSVLIAFESKMDRELVMSLLPTSCYINVDSSINNNHNSNEKEEEDSSNSCRIGPKQKKLQVKVLCHTDTSFIQKVMQYWRLGIISNFDYLLALNSAAGRSFHDLSRYPVFPWVLNDYESSKLDLKSNENSNNEKAIFRDLTKPIGALNEERLEQFQERWKSMKDMEDVTSFLYGTHYSAPGYCLYYLVRLMPEHMLCLQNGKYDAPDRLFHSIPHTFSSLLSNPADLKESIPQFYDTKSGVDLLLNLSGLQLGVTQNGVIINDVELPKWAKSPKDFLKKNRRALESEYCTNFLPNWIDLIFGEKSRGEKAEEAMNVFHPTSYLSPKDLNVMTSEEQKQKELQATEFGICPDQLFCAPHPHRNEKSVDMATLLNKELDRGLDIGSVDVNNGVSKDWELLPSHHDAVHHDSNSHEEKQITQASTSTIEDNSFPQTNEPGWSAIAEVSEKPNNSDTTTMDNDIMDDSKLVQTFYPKRIPLSGSGDSNRNIDDASDFRNGTFSHSDDKQSILKQIGLSKTSSDDSFRITTPLSKIDHNQKVGKWDFQSIASSQIHSDTVSGCHVSLGLKKSNITTSSLDGGLMVHILPNSLHEQNTERRGFTSHLNNSAVNSRFSSASSNRETYHNFRSHTSSDPLACLASIDYCIGNVSSNKNTMERGQIAFVGGHDDVILAYGINSACGLASVYSHRDVITGLDIVPFHCEVTSTMNTYILISGSWDATVKLWNVSISRGENVEISKQPLIELFDAEAPVSDVAGLTIVSNSEINDGNKQKVFVAAGCTDGSLTIWLWNGQEKTLKYREESRKNYGSCTCVKWTSSLQNEPVLLIAGFSNGRIASYVLKDDEFYPVGILDIGSPVNCLCVKDHTIFVGCEDGGLRLTTVFIDGHLDYQPQLFPAVNGIDCSPLTSIHSVVMDPNNAGATDNKSGNILKIKEKYLCVAGSGDGTVTTFYLSKV